MAWAADELGLEGDVVDGSGGSPVAVGFMIGTVCDESAVAVWVLVLVLVLVLVDVEVVVSDAVLVLVLSEEDLALSITQTLSL